MVWPCMMHQLPNAAEISWIEEMVRLRPGGEMLQRLPIFCEDRNINEIALETQDKYLNCL